MSDDLEVQATADNMTLLDGDNIEDLSVDNIQAAAGFIDPPDGLYILKVHKAYIHNYKVEEDARRKIQHQYGIHEVVELADANEPIPETGALFSEGFMIPDGLEYWKGKALSLLGKERMEGRSVGQVLNDLTESGILFKARVNTKTSKGKGDKANKTYNNIQVRVQEIIQNDPQLDA